MRIPYFKIVKLLILQIGSLGWGALLAISVYTGTIDIFVKVIGPHFSPHILRYPAMIAFVVSPFGRFIFAISAAWCIWMGTHHFHTILGLLFPSSDATFRFHVAVTVYVTAVTFGAFLYPGLLLLGIANIWMIAGVNVDPPCVFTVIQIARLKREGRDDEIYEGGFLDHYGPRSIFRCKLARPLLVFQIVGNAAAVIQFLL